MDPTDLAAVDKLCQWMDWPFLPNEWTKLYKTGKDRTLHLYARLMREKPQYETLDWAATNSKWRAARNNNTLEHQIDAISESWLEEMRRKWPSDIERTVDDYRYLEDFYNDLISTQNITSATQRDDAKRLVEVGLAATKKIRQGLPAKDEMAIYHNIMKAEGFEAKNARGIGDFDSCGELFTWLAKRGFKPNWHVEPQDSVDFTIKQVQNFLLRLVHGEGNLSDQVESRRKQLELANRLEEEEGFGQSDVTATDEEEAMSSIEYEGEEEFEEGDDNCLN